MLKILRYLGAPLLMVAAQLCGRDVLLEFKGAAFLPTDSCVKSIFGKSGALYGPEVTFQLSEYHDWYGFLSADFLSKKGCSIGLGDATQMNIVPLGIGLKYFVPFCYGDFYVGLGFQPLHLKTINCSPDVMQITSKWGFGGIAKVGTYVDLPCHFFLDFFVDYSFVQVGCDTCAASAALVVPIKTSLNGAVVGIGLGYRFN